MYYTSVSSVEGPMISTAIRPSYLAAVAAACLLLCACGMGGKPATDEGEKKPEEVAIPVEVAKAALRPMLASYTGTAALEAEREAQVVAKTSGVLQRLLVEEGDVVREGQLLAELDPERPRLEVARAQADLNRLENDFRRSQELFSAKLVSSEAHDKIRFDLETQRAAHDLAKLDLSYTRIVAPIDGVISQRMVKEGNFIQLQSTLFRIDDFDPLLAVLNVPERELRTLRPGLTVAMQVDALAGKNFEGKVARISPVVDAATGTFRVTCEFTDRSGQLKSGMFGRLSVVFDQRAEVLTVPREAVMEDGDQPALFAIRDGKAVRQSIRAGARSGGLVEILEGVADGEQVVTVGASTLRDGAKVQVLEAAK
jgi:membrane fusion protein (multidrug efflux system)